MTKLDGSELVLCAPAGVIDDLGRWEGYRTLSGAGPAWAVTTILGRAVFVPRTVGLEQGQSGLRWRQVIPYVVLTPAGGDRVFVYRRPARGGDPRLAGFLTLGLGGHVNPVDFGEESDGVLAPSMLARCIARELGQEVDLEIAGAPARLAGLLNDESDDVGRRHLGMVYVLATDMEPRPAHLEVEEGGWHTPEVVRGRPIDHWEGWSRILAPRVARLMEAVSDRVPASGRLPG